MKRAFLFGFACVLLGGALAVIFLGSVGAARTQSMVVGLCFLPIGFGVMWLAKRAPHHQSRLVAVLFWLIGFFAPPAAVRIGLEIFDRWVREL